MATPSRFADLSRQEIAVLVEEKDSKNTQSATKTALSRPSAERNILTKARILKKFQKKNYTNSLLTFIPMQGKKPEEFQEDSTNKHSLWPATIL